MVLFTCFWRSHLKRPCCVKIKHRANGTKLSIGLLLFFFVLFMVLLSLKIFYSFSVCQYQNSTRSIFLKQSCYLINTNKACLFAKMYIWYFLLILGKEIFLDALTCRRIFLTLNVIPSIEAHSRCELQMMM